MTQSGKSTLAKQLATSINRSGKPILVFDPTANRQGKGVNGWTGAMVYNDFEHFEMVFWKSRGCFVIIDEAGEVFDEHRQQARRMITRGRHNGHVVMLIAQRFTLLDKTARDQASQIYTFTVDPDDAKEMARRWNCPELATAHQLPQFHYIQLSRHGQPTRGRVR